MEEGGAMTWPDNSLITEEMGLSCDITPAMFDCNDSEHTYSLNVMDDGRLFVDSVAICSSISELGLGLDEWMKEDSIDSMAEMDSSCISSSTCGDLFPAKLEQEFSSFPSTALDAERSGGKDAVLLPAVWGSHEEMDLDDIDAGNAFRLQQPQTLPSCSSLSQLLLDSISSNTATTDLISTQTVASPKVSIQKLTDSRMVDLKKIIVKKPILDKAVERLGGGKNGALNLWKLIQVWLKHRKSPPNEMPAWPAAMAADIHEASSLHATTNSTSQLISVVEDLPDPDMDLPPLFDCSSQANTGLNTIQVISSHDEVSVASTDGHDGLISQDPPFLPRAQNGQQQIATRDSATTIDHLNVCFSDKVSCTVGLPLSSKIRALNVSPPPPLTPPALDVTVLHRVQAAGIRLNQKKSSEEFEQQQQQPSNMSSMQQQQQLRLKGNLREGQSMEGTHVSTDSRSQAMSMDHHAVVLPIMDAAAAGEALMMGSSCTSAAATRAARKNRMARQRRSLAHRHTRLIGRSACLRYPSLHASYGASYLNSFDRHALQAVNSPYAPIGRGRKPNSNLKMFLQKELRLSDVGNLGRIVLPKKESESYLPNLTAREGVAISMEDMNSSRTWDFRYRVVQQELTSESLAGLGCGRFWPNNKTRMYLLENTADFVKFHSLEEGDTMMLYKDCRSGKYVIGRKKVLRTDSSTIGSLITPVNPCKPCPLGLEELSRELMKVEEVGSSSSSVTTELEESICTNWTSSTISTTAEPSQDVPSSSSIILHQQSDDGVQLSQNCFVEQLIEEFVNELPVLERFPSLDTTAAGIQLDEIFELDCNLAAASAAVASECRIENWSDHVPAKLEEDHA